MKSSEYTGRIMQILTMPPVERHAAMAELHGQALLAYQAAISSMDAQRAAQTSTDGRSLLQVVAHITEWERYMLLAAGELLAGVKNLQMMALKGWVEPDGSVHTFASIDHFNARQVERHTATPWEQIQAQALQTSSALLAVFTHPDLITPDLLEATAPDEMRGPDGVVVPVTSGWLLWHITIEHAVVEHAADLGLEH